MSSDREMHFRKAARIHAGSLQLINECARDQRLKSSLPAQFRAFEKVLAESSANVAGDFAELYEKKLDDWRAQLGEWRQEPSALANRRKALKTSLRRKYNFDSASLPLLEIAQRLTSTMSAQQDSETRELELVDVTQAIFPILQKLSIWDVDISVDENLLSDAISSRNSLVFRKKMLPRVELARLALHESLHIAIRRHAAKHEAAIFAIGTHDGEEQEGLALLVEEIFGVLSPARKRQVAIRVLVAEKYSAGKTELAAREELSNLPLDAALLRREVRRVYRDHGRASIEYLAGWLQLRQEPRLARAMLSGWVGCAVAKQYQDEIKLPAKTGFLQLIDRKLAAL